MAKIAQLVAGDYNMLDNIPVINADLDNTAASTADQAVLYHHTGESTTTYKKAAFYYTDGTSWLQFKGEKGQDYLLYTGALKNTKYPYTLTLNKNDFNRIPEVSEDVYIFVRNIEPYTSAQAGIYYAHYRISAIDESGSITAKLIGNMSSQRVLNGRSFRQTAEKLDTTSTVLKVDKIASYSGEDGPVQVDDLVLSTNAETNGYVGKVTKVKWNNAYDVYTYEAYISYIGNIRGPQGAPGTTDYNVLDNIPVINQDLSASGFTPVANTYYRHTGATTDTFTQGVIYLYDTTYHKLGESGGGTTLNRYEYTSTSGQDSIKRAMRILNTAKSIAAFDFNNLATTMPSKQVSYHMKVSGFAIEDNKQVIYNITLDRADGQLHSADRKVTLSTEGIAITQPTININIHIIYYNDVEIT